MLTEKYNPELGIVETTLTESVTTEDILNHYAFIRRNKELPRDVKILIDASEAKLAVDAQDIRSVEKSVNVTKLKYEKIREAIVVNKTFEFAMTTLSSMISKGKMTFKAFTDKADALSWLHETEE